MAYKIGQTVTLNNETYVISGKHQRSFILDKGGKQYKVTAAKMDKIKNQKAPSPTHYMDYRLSSPFNNFNKLPETREEVEAWADAIACELSPENLFCDGEISRSQAAKKQRMLKAEHKELEKLAGRKVALEY